MLRKKTLSWSAVAAAVTVGVAWFAWPRSDTNAAMASPAATPAPAVVVLARATKAELTPIHWGPGDVVSHDDARVAAETSGRVQRIVEVGRHVRKGEIVAWLDDTAASLKVRELKATLGRIDAQLAYSRRQEERYESLQRERVVSASFADQLRAEREIKEHEREIARAVLDDAMNRMAHTVIRAPFDGIVAERLVMAGEFLQESEPVVRLVGTRQLEIRAKVPITLVRRLAGSGRVWVRDGATTAEQPLLSFIPVGDGPSRQLELRIAADGLDLPIGSALEVGIPDGESGASITVPRDAVVLRREGAHVVRVNAENLAERIVVETAGAVDDRIAVRGDLREGDRVVVRGGERVQPGQPVREIAL